MVSSHNTPVAKVKEEDTMQMDGQEGTETILEPMTNDQMDVGVDATSEQEEPKTSENHPLNTLESNHLSSPVEIPSIIRDIANGTVQQRYSWNQIRESLEKLLRTILNEGDMESEEKIVWDRVLNHLRGLPSIPFTIQRLCELTIDPKSHRYSRVKYLRALEKVITVSSGATDPCIIGKENVV